MSPLPHIPRKEEGWQNLAKIIDAQNRVRHIGKELRYEFDAIAHEPLPKEFIELLNRLEQQSSDEAAAAPQPPNGSAK